MIRFNLVLSLLMLCAGLTFAQDFRPPAVPLVAHDPYFSVWSQADRLYDTETTHWTGRRQAMHSILRIDGKAYKIMGFQPERMAPIRQKKLEVFPTRSVYTFENTEVNLVVTFTTPALMSDLDLYSRPVTYISWEVKSIDGKEHDVQLYFDCNGEIAVESREQEVEWSAPEISGLNTVSIGTTTQPVLAKKGDDLRIDWGYAYLSVPAAQNATVVVNNGSNLIRSFSNDGKISGNAFSKKASRDRIPSMASCWNMGKVGTQASKAWAMLAYDDIKAIKYFDTELEAWWKRDGMTIEELLVVASNDYDHAKQLSAEFDAELMADMEKMGGEKYARVCALVYRQCIAAHKLCADQNDMPLIFSKENNSNGCIATVDVIYPAAPFFFLFSPALTKANLQPNFDYAASKRWKFPFAPHDLGTYPHATGQSYGGGENSEENQMPVEETGNMILMTAALAKMEGNADYAVANWPVLEKWAEYLLSKGFDPENQLCTDDFAGHLAHNINLSAKAIEAIGAYAMLCEMTGKTKEAKRFRKEAEIMAQKWIEQSAEGDHTRLAYDRPNTWAQKYNLVWDKLLGINLFPAEVLKKEIEFYKTVQGEYGLPLDSRQRYTKNDWVTWTATMADNKADFRAIFDPVYKFANYTPQRVPLTDWYWVDNGYHRGFKARSVVGGFFIKMLDDKTMWEKWVAKGTNTKGNWAPLKFIEITKVVLEPSVEKAFSWKYTMDKPADNWYSESFDDSSWGEGKAPFGTVSNSRTDWSGSDIWIRREFTLNEVSDEKLALMVLHDEDATVYINGEKVVMIPGYTGNYDKVYTGRKVSDLLRKGKNTIAIHCQQTTGGQAVDIGLGEYKDQK